MDNIEKSKNQCRVGLVRITHPPVGPDSSRTYQTAPQAVIWGRLGVEVESATLTEQYCNKLNFCEKDNRLEPCRFLFVVIIYSKPFIR